MKLQMSAGRWWRTPLFPALGRQRQADLCEFEASLVYRASSRTTWAVTQRNPVLKNKTKKQKSDVHRHVNLCLSLQFHYQPVCFDANTV